MVGAVLSVIAYVGKRPLPVFVLPIILVGGVVVLIVYHKFYSGKSKWISPGERLVGRVLHHEHKVWRNPYGRNRWALYLILFVSLIMAGNSWDALGYGLIMPLGQIFSKVFWITVLLYGLMTLGEGKLYGVIFVASYYWIVAIGLMLLPASDQYPDDFLGFMKGEFSIFFLVVGLIAVVTGIVYYRIRKMA